MNAELGLALRDVLRHRAAGNELCLGVHLTSDPELVEKTSDVDAARATGGWIDIGNGLGGEQRLLEGRDRADVRLRRAVLDYDADADARQVRPTTSDELPFVRKIVDCRGREHREVEHLAALDALAQRTDGIVLDGDLVAGRSLEIGHERKQHLLEGAGGEHLDLRRRGASRRAGRHDHHRNPQQHHLHGLLHCLPHLTVSVAQTMGSRCGACASATH
jgi:hypothetical protein